MRGGSEGLWGRSGGKEVHAMFLAFFDVDEEEKMVSRLQI